MADVAVDKKALIEGERPIMNASYGKLMMWFFLVSDAFTFSTLLVAYGALRISAVSDGWSWAYPEDVFTHVPLLYEIWHIEAPLLFVGLMTFVLILSSVTMVLAVEAGHRKSQKEVAKWVFWTIIGGAAFLSCQAYEWYHFISGTPNGGVLVPTALVEEYDLGGGIPDYEDLQIVEFRLPGHGQEGEGHEGGDHAVTSLELFNGDKITDSEAIEKILDDAHHTHAGTYYLENYFHYAQGVGHINYNYFLIDNIRNYPHLLMTYTGTSFKRTLANVNNDKFPEYYEHIFYNLNDKVYSKDSVAFKWSEKDTLYINTRNQKQTRRY